MRMQVTRVSVLYAESPGFVIYIINTRLFVQSVRCTVYTTQIVTGVEVIVENFWPECS